jgi:hypothetical protein
VGSKRLIGLDRLGKKAIVSPASGSRRGMISMHGYSGQVIVNGLQPELCAIALIALSHWPYSSAADVIR